MKITHHIPTEQYGFTEVEMSEADFVPYEMAKSLYGASGASGGGLDSKEYNRCVEEYLETGSLRDGTELYQKMSPAQQDWFQVTKRALARIKSKTS